MSERTTVGVIGLGAMGAPMAARLLQAGPVAITSRRSQEALLASGAQWAETPRELALLSGAILAMLPDLPQLEAALTGPDGILAADRPLLLMIGSTSSAPAVRALAERLRPHGIRVVDCPVSGGEDGANAGTLSIMIGGDEADTAEATELLRPCGRPVRLGPLGAGQVAKACNQMIVSSTILALADATVLADRSGLDLEAFWHLLSGGYAGSNLLESRRRKLIDEEYSASGMASYMVKDLGFAAAIAESTGTSPALLDTLRARFAELVDAGLGDQDIAVARRFVEGR